MKWIIFLTLLVTGAFFTWEKLKEYPYKTYQDLLSGKKSHSEYIELAKIEEKILAPISYELYPMGKLNQNDDKYWKKFHFSHFEMNLAYDHPLFIPVPILKATNFGPQIGLGFFNTKRKLVFSFEILKPFEFERFGLSDKIFNLPLSERYLNRIGEDKIWKDLFSFKIDKKCVDCSYDQLLYHLYILKVRQNFFKMDHNSFSFYEDKKMGVMRSSSPQSAWDVEHIFILKNGMVYPIKIKFLKDSYPSYGLREKIMTTTVFRKSTIDSRVPLFAEYQNLGVADQRSLKAINFLYSAWSHDKENEQYFKLLIRNLERVDMRARMLDGLYKYSYKNYGSTFSKFGRSFKETSKRKLKREMEEELKEEIEEGKAAKVVVPEENFKSEKEKQTYLLNESNQEEFEESDEMSLD